MAKGWMFGAKNIPCLTISGYVCNKYPLQRDIFCLEKLRFMYGPLGPVWSFAPYEALLLGWLKLGFGWFGTNWSWSGIVYAQLS